MFDQRRFMLTRFARLLAILARGAYDMKVAVHLEEDGARLLQFDGKNPTEAGGMIDDCFVEFDGTVIATVEYKDLGLKPHWVRSILPLLREDPLYSDVLGETLLAAKMNEFERFSLMFEPSTWKRVVQEQNCRHFGLVIVPPDTDGGYRLRLQFHVSGISRALNREMMLAAADGNEVR
ncbi:MAG: hypothetical protein ABSH14_01640 [Verrucomicrobiia bacterium]